MGLILVLGGLMVAGLLVAEQQQNQRLRWVFKPAASTLFIIAAAVAGIDDFYALVVLIGLALCWWGDILLIPDSRVAFMAGVGAFLLGHVAYIMAFNSVVIFTRLHLGWVLLVAVISSAFFAWLRPHVGAMRFMVLAYVVTITIMVWSAWAIYFESPRSADFRWLIVLGATSFYVSDLAVAIDRFVQPQFNNAYWGLPLYYAGQFMLALSLAP